MIRKTVRFQQRSPNQKSVMVFEKQIEPEKFEKFMISSIQNDCTEEKQPPQSKDMIMQKFHSKGGPVYFCLPCILKVRIPSSW